MSLPGPDQIESDADTIDARLTHQASSWGPAGSHHQFRDHWKLKGSCLQSTIVPAGGDLLPASCEAGPWKKQEGTMRMTLHVWSAASKSPDSLSYSNGAWPNCTMTDRVRPVVRDSARHKPPANVDRCGLVFLPCGVPSFDLDMRLACPDRSTA